MSTPQTFRARWVFPIASPPIHNGRITLLGNVVQTMDTSPVEGEIDLGDVALIPGWVNAHTHLELSDLTQPLGTSGMLFPQWIAEVLRHRSQTANADPQGAIQLGLNESSQAGVRLVVDILQPSHISTVSALSSGSCFHLPLMEILGLEIERGREALRQGAQFLSESGKSGQVGLSPHAPYSTRREFVERAVELATRFRVPLAMHLAETPDEELLTLGGKGLFADWLQQIGRWQADVFPNAMATGDWLALLAGAQLPLVIHGNYLSRASIDFLATQHHMTVVYCPRTHAYFKHPPHPVDQLIRAGVRVALGTDSRASNPDLSLGKEVAFLLRHRSDLEPRSVLEMATINGADAVGCGWAGRFVTGCEPGMISIPVGNDANPWSAIAAGLVAHYETTD